MLRQIRYIYEHGTLPEEEKADDDDEIKTDSKSDVKINISRKERCVNRIVRQKRKIIN